MPADGWATARDELMLVKWPTSRKRLESSLEQERSSVRQALERAKVD
jgi:hypothetical protein